MIDRQAIKKKSRIVGLAFCSMSDMTTKGEARRLIRRNRTHTKITGLVDCKHLTNTFDEAMRRLDKKQRAKPRNGIVYLKVENCLLSYLLFKLWSTYSARGGVQNENLVNARSVFQVHCCCSKFSLKPTIPPGASSSSLLVGSKSLIVDSPPFVINPSRNGTCPARQTIDKSVLVAKLDIF